MACSSFMEIFEKLEKELILFGILPVENSTEGAVTSVMDSLLDLKEIYIQEEVTYRIRHHLFNTTGQMSDVKKRDFSSAGTGTMPWIFQKTISSSKTDPFGKHFRCLPSSSA